MSCALKKKLLHYGTIQRSMYIYFCLSLSFTTSFTTTTKFIIIIIIKHDKLIVMCSGDVENARIELARQKFAA